MMGIHPTALNLFINENPLPKERPRVIRSRSQKTNRVSSRTYTPPRTKAWEELVQLRFKEAFPGHIPLAGPLAIELYFVRSTHRRVDLDNLIKAILDALNGVAWVDDDQIISLKAQKHFKSEMGGTGVGLLIYQLDADSVSTMTDRAAAILVAIRDMWVNGLPFRRENGR